MNYYRWLLLPLLVLLPLMAVAEEIDGINYTLRNFNDNNIKSQAEVTARSSGTYSGQVVIPEKVEYTSTNWWWTSTQTYRVTSIADRAFADSRRLTAVTIPVSVTKVGQYAFQACSSLRHIYSNMLYPQSLGNKSFSSVSKDCVLHIPVGTLTAYEQAGWSEASTGITIVEEGEPAENYCIENPVNHDFIRLTDYPDNDYTFTRITDYTTQETPYRKDLPAPVCIVPPAVNDGRAFLLELFADRRLVRSETYALQSKVLQVWNLIPQKSYTYRLSVLQPNGTPTVVTSGSFRTTGQVRMMNIDGVYNCRDIGGWRLPGGRRVKYDRIFRSGELEVPGKLSISDAGIHELIDVQGIGVEIDFGDYDGSPVSKWGIDFYRGSNYQIMQYTNSATQTYQQNKHCFEATVNSLRAGKKVIFHCNLGADRTGSFAFLLEALLGVSESDLAKDYEMTSYTYDQRYRTASDNDNNENEHGYRRYIAYIKKTFPGNTFSEKVEQMALSFGIRQTDIDDFRRLMTETVLDEDSLTPPVAATDVDVCVHRTIKADEWSTLCLPFAMTADQLAAAFGDDVQLAQFNDYVYDAEADILTVGFANVTSLEANHPYIIKVSEPIVDFTVAHADIDPQETLVDFDDSPLHDQARQMAGTYVANTMLDYGWLFLNGGNLWYSVGKTQMKGYRAWFNFHDRLSSMSATGDGATPTSSSRLALSLNPLVTAVGRPRSSTTNDSRNLYDLQGRRVTAPRRGLYISRLDGNSRNTIIMLNR